MKKATKGKMPARVAGIDTLSEEGCQGDPEKIVLQYVDAYYKWVDECRRLDQLVDEGKIGNSTATKKMLSLRSEFQERLCTSVAPMEYGLSYPVRSPNPPKVPEEIIECKKSGSGLVVVRTKVHDKNDWYAAFPFNLYKLKKTPSGWRICELAATKPGNTKIIWRIPS